MLPLLISYSDLYPEVSPPSADLCPLWRVERWPTPCAHGYVSPALWCRPGDLDFHRLPPGLLSPGVYVLASPGGEEIARFRVPSASPAAPDSLALEARSDA